MSDKVLCEMQDLVNIADAVRQVTGSTDKLNVSQLSTRASTIISGGGAISHADWSVNDETDLSYIQNRTHYEAPASFDITWDGVIGDRFALDMSQFGFDGVHFVKVSDYVPTLEGMIGAKIIDRDNEEMRSPVMPEDCDTYNFPGVYDVRSWVVVCYDADTLSSAIGIPSGIITNGTYFYIDSGQYYTSRFVGRDNTKKLDAKYLPEGYPYEIEPQFNIIWNGDMTGRTVMDMTPLGYDGTYFVKTSDIVLSKEDVISSSYAFNWNCGIRREDIQEWDIHETYPGTYDIINEIVVVHDQATLNATLGLPEGYLTNGVYFVANPTNQMYIARFTGKSEVEKIDERYLPDMSVDLSNYYFKSEVDAKIANAIGGAIGGSY